MKIECLIDGKSLSLALDSNKPLSLVLQEYLESPAGNANCSGEKCGRCAVLIDNKSVLSCMVPAFEINGKEIKTYESLKKEEITSDIQAAFRALGIHPCPLCLPSRVVLYYSIIDSGETRRDEISREMSILKCTCMDKEDDINVIMKVLELRRKRRVRRA